MNLFFWSLMSIMNRQSSIIRRPSSVFRSTFVENIRQIHPFYAKQSQFSAILAQKHRFQEKTNPIQTQFKANLTQNKPNLSQYKANSNPNLSKFIPESCLLGSQQGTYIPP